MTTPLLSYAVTYAKDGAFLLAWRPVLRYYAGDGKTGDVWRNGAMFAGGANYVLPAALIGASETITSAALRGFTQATGQPMPPTIATAEHKFSEATAAAYFCLTDAAALRALDVDCNTVSLPNASRIASAIADQRIKKYSEIAGYAAKNGCVPWPYDNTLQQTQHRNILDPETWNWVQTWQDPRSGLAEIYDVMAYLHDTVLDAAGRTVATAQRRLGVGRARAPRAATRR